MKAIVLAAGKGKRLLCRDIPKVLKQANGKALIDYALAAIGFIQPSDTVVVAGYQKEKVIEHLGPEYQFAVQAEQKGTGHAVQMAAPYFEGYDGDVIITYGDMPLFQRNTFEQLIEKHKKSGADCTILTAVTNEPMAYGRIIRGMDERLRDIVEEKDCTDLQKKIDELNVGVYVFRSKVLFEYISKLDNNNAQGEFYLTDVPKILINNQKAVESYTIYDSDEIFGVNTPEDLKRCEDILGKRDLHD